MNTNHLYYLKRSGFSLVELMVALTLGLILIGGVISVYLAQDRTYKAGQEQSAIQDEENAIAALVIPAVRSAGFLGCSSTTTAVSALPAGAPPPLGKISTTPSMVAGYDYNNTAGAGTTYTITTDNPPNDGTFGDWTPALDASFAIPGAAAAPGSDVLVLLGATPLSQPVGVSPAPAANAASLVINSTTTSSGSPQFTAGGLAAISDCAKTEVFQNTGNGQGAMVVNPKLAYSYSKGAQVVPIQQTAIFVGYGQAGESQLMEATLQILNGVYNWSTSGTPAVIGASLVPGVEAMQVLYGIGANGVVTEYLPANLVTKLQWAQVDTVRIGFLLEGKAGSAPLGQPRTYTVLGTTFTVPADTKMRHVFEMTINLRNSL